VGEETDTEPMTCGSGRKKTKTIKFQTDSNVIRSKSVLLGLKRFEIKYWAIILWKRNNFAYWNFCWFKMYFSIIIQGC
jgi:hypothetical protein